MEGYDYKSMTPEQLQILLREFGQPVYRAGQLFGWLHQGATSFSDMTNLPLDLRQALARRGYIADVSIVRRLRSSLDDTVKYLYALRDGEHVESVLMHYHYGYSVCISTQAGCRMGCAFCASCLAGLSRNLTASEMIAQVQAAQRDNGVRVSHVVLMGMGEPLDNFEQTIRFLELATHKDGLRISARHISVSTCGVVPRIYDLAKRNMPITLSVSLHAPNDAIRGRIMPVNRKWNVAALLQACRGYIAQTSRRISFEYALLAGVNDAPSCAEELASRLKGMLCHVNLIPANVVKERDFRRPEDRTVREFAAVLTRRGINNTVRRTLGADIQASCGQLRRNEGR